MHMFISKCLQKCIDKHWALPERSNKIALKLLKSYKCNCHFFLLQQDILMQNNHFYLATLFYFYLFYFLFGVILLRCSYIL